MSRPLRIYFVAAVLLCGAAGLLAQIVCQVGNLEDPIGPPVPGIVRGDQIFAYLIHPQDQCDCNEESVQLQSMLMWLEFDPGMVPVNFVVHAGLRPAFYDAAFDQWIPDGYFYESADIMMEVVEPGPFLLQVPAINARWIPVHEYFFLTLTFETPFEANLLCDGMDEPGIAYVSHDGQDWFDLFGPDKTSGGKPIIWGDVLCGADDGTTPAPVPETAPRLEAPHPNPFNPRTSLRLGLDRPGELRLAVHDARGRLVKVLADERRPAGVWRYNWDGTDEAGRLSPAGVYFFRAETAGGVVVRKAALVK